MTFEPGEPALLDPDVVEVWCVDLDSPPVPWPSLETLLDADERARANRLRDDVARRRWSVARGLLRLLLGRMLDRDPSSIAFIARPSGKPAIEGAPLEFNASHSAGLALVAASRSGEVGVDVEAMRPVDVASIARLRFSSMVQRELSLLAADELVEAFYERWTHEEALLKASGDGLRRIVTGETSPGWQVHELRPSRGHVGALAAPEALPVRRFRWRLASPRASPRREVQHDQPGHE